ncbi:MAG: metal ABC transporter permease [Planctomycetales bacterium]
MITRLIILVSLFADHIHIDLLHFVTGNVLAVSDADLWVAGFVACAVLAFIVLCFRQLQLIAFDPVMAASLGIPVVMMDYLLTASTSFVVVSGVTMVGMILVVGLLVTPAATAYLLCDRLSRMLVVSACFGVTSVVGGLYMSLWMNVAGGSAIVLFSTVQFLAVLALAPRYGLIANWLRISRMAPREVIEKILRCILKGEGQPVSMDTVFQYVDAKPDDVHRAVAAMERQDLISATGGILALTESGRHEARRILRAHRLWESYLKHVGMPESDLHEQAERLQHVYDEEAVDYLDDKLGHPLRDPHGAEIPEDFVHLVAGQVIKASLLREGHAAVVESVDSSLDSPLEPGMRIRVGPRQEQETKWTILLPDGSEVRLDHDAADSVHVRVSDPDVPDPNDPDPSS